MGTTWSISVDWDHNGDYSDAQDDVTSRLISASWKLGMHLPFSDVAR